MIINLTGHIVDVVDEDGKLIKFDRDTINPPVRVAEKVEYIGRLDGVPIVRKFYTFVTNLPDEVEGVYYIVPNLVRVFLSERQDLLSPGEPARDKYGVKMGVSSLVTNKREGGFSKKETGEIQNDKTQDV